MGATTGSCKTQFFLQVGPDNVENYDATAPFTTDGISKEGNASVSKSGPYQIQAILTGSDGPAKFTVQQSSNGVNWDTVIDGADIVIPSNDSHTFEDTVFTGAYLRVLYDNDANTSGTVTFILTQD